jgi:hypothetical protein
VRPRSCWGSSGRSSGRCGGSSSGLRVGKE